MSGYVGLSQLKKQKLEAAGSRGAVQALRMENADPVVGPDAPTVSLQSPRASLALHYLAALQARGANAQAARGAALVLQAPLYRTQVHVPAPLGDVVGVADVVTELRPF